MPDFSPSWNRLSGSPLHACSQKARSPRLLAVIFSPLRSIWNTTKRHDKRTPGTARRHQTTTDVFPCSSNETCRTTAPLIFAFYRRMMRSTGDMRPSANPVFMPISGPCSTFVLLSAELCEAFSTAKKKGGKGRRPFIHADSSMSTDSERKPDKSDRMPL